MHHMRAGFAFKDRDFARAAKEAALAERYLDAPAFRDLRAATIATRAAACAESDDAPKTVALLEPLLEMEAMNPGVRSAVEDNLAWAYLLLDDAALTERALPLLASARSIQPWETSFAVAEACVLAASADSSNQRLARAQQLVKTLERERLDRQNAAYTALAKGLCAAAEGDAKGAIRHRDRAKTLGATAAPLRVLERRLPSP
jgi:hypothetical protein